MLGQAICLLGNKPETDFHGIAVGLIAFFVAFFYVGYLLQKFDLNRKPIMNIVFISGLGHFVGAYVLYWFSILYGSDSCFYFENATLTYQGFQYWFAFFVLGYMRHYILGESFLGAFLLSGAIAFIGSVYYFLTYKILLDKISNNKRLYIIDKNQLLYPAFILLCWPSYLFWSAALVKDNFAFLSIGLTLFIIAQGKFSFSTFIKLFFASSLAIIVRPYLLTILIASTIIYILLGSKKNLVVKITFIAIIMVAMLILVPYLNTDGSLIHVSGHSLSAIGNYTLRQQVNMHTGSSIPIPTHNPYLVFLFIPYLILANLFLPLGIGARNMIGIISSIENVYLISLCIFFIKNKFIWNELVKNIALIKFYLIYFIIGMSCLSIMCTNLGLSMREKMMYVPALLICILLTYAYRRILIIQHYYYEEEIRLSENQKALNPGF